MVLAQLGVAPDHALALLRAFAFSRDLSLDEAAAASSSLATSSTRTTPSETGPTNPRHPVPAFGDAVHALAEGDAPQVLLRTLDACVTGWGLGRRA